MEKQEKSLKARIALDLRNERKGGGYSVGVEYKPVLDGKERRKFISLDGPTLTREEFTLIKDKASNPIWKKLEDFKQSILFSVNILGSSDPNAVRAYLRQESSQNSIGACFDKCIAFKEGKVGSNHQDTLEWTKNTINKFTGNVYSLTIDKITVEWCFAFERYIVINQGNSRSSVRSHMANLKATLTWAAGPLGRLINLGEIYPFVQGGYAVGTTPRALRTGNKAAFPIEIIKVLTKWKGGLNEVDLYNQALYSFSFEGFGMNMSDIARIQHRDVLGSVGGKPDRIVFQRNKNKKRLGSPAEYTEVTITKELRRIITKFGQKSLDPNGYLFPILMPGMDNRTITDRVKTRARMVTKTLRKINGLAKLKLNENSLKFGTARHSFATIVKSALAEGGALSGLTNLDLSEMLSHSSEKTTEIYTASLIDSGKQAEILEFREKLREAR